MWQDSMAAQRFPSSPSSAAFSLDPRLQEPLTPGATPRRWSKARHRAVQSWVQRRERSEERSTGGYEANRRYVLGSRSRESPEACPQDISRIFARLAVEEE